MRLLQAKKGFIIISATLLIPSLSHAAGLGDALQGLMGFLQGIIGHFMGGSAGSTTSIMPALIPSSSGNNTVGNILKNQESSTGYQPKNLPDWFTNSTPNQLISNVPENWVRDNCANDLYLIQNPNKTFKAAQQQAEPGQEIIGSQIMGDIVGNALSSCYPK